MRTSHRFSKVVLLAVAMALVAIWGMGDVESATGILDGKTFIVHEGFMGEEASSEDDISFKKGKFYSTNCAQWGFGWGDYTAKVTGNTVYFEAVTSSPKHGKIMWKGQVNGDALEGSYIWTKKRWYWKDARQEQWLRYLFLATHHLDNRNSDVVFLRGVHSKFADCFEYRVLYCLR